MWLLQCLHCADTRRSPAASDTVPQHGTVNTDMDASVLHVCVYTQRSNNGKAIIPHTSITFFLNLVGIGCKGGQALPKLSAILWHENPVLTGNPLKYHFSCCTVECDVAESSMLSSYLDLFTKLWPSSDNSYTCKVLCVPTQNSTATHRYSK